ncbi:MAG: two-component regulator propeller domain-containing protein, partial [Ignavibacteria bacterium]|nr:two-component regulator propeller domain-containing protein [Ignavibacteria bacterium]
QNFCYDIANTTNTIWSVNFAGGLRKSTNKGATWQRVVLPPDNLNSIKPTDTLKFSLQPSAGKFGNESYLNHRAFSIYADNDNTIWVGTAGGINKSTDGGTSWQKFNHTNQTKPISGNYILAIEKNEYDNSIWAATWKAEGQTEDWGVSRTTDGGLTWDTFLLGERALDFAFKYYGPKGNYTGADIIVATRNGLFRSANNGSTWIALNSIVDLSSNIKLETNTFLAAETSRLNDGTTDFWIGTDNGLVYTNEKNSIWDGDWRIFLASGSSADATESFAFPNPFSPNKEKIKIKFSLKEHSDVTIRILNFGMNLVKTVIQNASRSANEEQIEIWDGRDEFGSLVPNGVYFYRIDKNSDKPIFGKIMVLM